MDNNKTQQTWTEASAKLFCGQCKAVRLLIWNRTKGTDAPQHATVIGDQWVGAHCDYFRRRVEHPEQLAQCGAFQKRADKRERQREDPAGAPSEARDSE